MKVCAPLGPRVYLEISDDIPPLEQYLCQIQGKAMSSNLKVTKSGGCEQERLIQVTRKYQKFLKFYKIKSLELMEGIYQKWS